MEGQRTDRNMKFYLREIVFLQLSLHPMESMPQTKSIDQPTQRVSSMDKMETGIGLIFGWGSGIGPQWGWNKGWWDGKTIEWD